MGFKGSKGSGFRVQVVLRVLRVVRCIIIRKRRGVLEYMIFAKDKKAVNLQNPLNL